jgi:hypothetical protein
MNIPIEKVCPVINSPIDEYRGTGRHTKLPRKVRRTTVCRIESKSINTVFFQIMDPRGAEKIERCEDG